MEQDKNIYFDDYARKQASPKRDLASMNIDRAAAQFKRPATGTGPCEWDRLMKEREELLQSGCYGPEDPLIKEIERQIQASQ